VAPWGKVSEVTVNGLLTPSFIELGSSITPQWAHWGEVSEVIVKGLLYKGKVL
jgi:hypothetical protein